MKKIMLSAAVLAFAGMATVNAETIKSPINTEIAINVQDKTPVKAGDLPDAVKQALAGDDYSGWTVKEAFSVQTAGGVPSYEISLEKDGENKTVNLNEAGQAAEASTQQTAPTQEPTSETTPSEATPGTEAPVQ